MDALKFLGAVLIIIVLPAVLCGGMANHIISGDGQQAVQAQQTGQLTGAISDQAGAIETLSNTVSEMARELVNMANRLVDAKQEQIDGLQGENRALRSLLYGAGVIILVLVLVPRLNRKENKQ